jgi:hypothetical protein
MNRFVFHVEIERWSEGLAVASGAASVDGTTLEAPAVHIGGLVDSLIEPGKHWLFTCGCGDAACGHVDQRVAVTHKDGQVKWRFRTPIAYWKPGMPQLPPDQEIEQWIKRSRQVRLTFDRLAMIDEVVEAIDWVLEEVPEDLPEEHQLFFVPGVSREELMAMRSDLLRCRATIFLH